MAVIDRLGAALEEIFAHGLQPCLLRVSEGQVRVRANRSDLTGILDAAFHPIRQAGSSHPAILIHIAQTLANLASATREAHQRDAMGMQLDRLAETAASDSFASSDSKDVVRAIQDARLELSLATQPAYSQGGPELEPTNGV